MKRFLTTLFSLLLLTIATMSTAQTYDLWNGKIPSSGAATADAGPTVGFAVTAMVDGNITGLRWYKPSGSGGTRQGGIWTTDTSSGFAGFNASLVRSGTFTNETASGWQTLTFTQPYPLAAGKSVIVGVFYGAGSTVLNEVNRTDATTYTNASNTLKIIADRAYFTATGSLAFPEVGMDDIPWVDVVFTTTGGGGGNQPPSANAGSDQNIITPASSVTLNGSGTDPDGSISSYAWTKVSGPAGQTITSPSSASTTVTGLVEGTYVFRLTVTDNGGSSATDDVQVIVASTSTGNLSFTKIPFSDPDFRRPNSGLEFWIYQSLIRIPEAGSPADNETQRYDRWEWRAFEETQGVYNWALFDESINLAISRGQTFAFAVMGSCGGCSDFQVSINGATNKTLPNYVIQNGGAWNYGGVWYPNWNSSVYKNALRNFHNALAQHILTGSYNGVPYRNVIKYIDLRGVGEYDEWHFYPMLAEAESGGYKPTIASYKEIVDIFTTAYNDFRLTALSDGFDPSGWSNTPPEVIHYLLTRSTKKGPIGWRRDNWGHNQSWYSAKLEDNPAVFNGIVLKNLITERWKTAPVVGEPLQCCTMDNGSTLYYDLPRQASFYHLSNLGNGNLENPGDANTISNMRLASKTMGYRITLNSGSMPDTIFKGTPFSLSLTWANEGVAPPYDPWQIVFQLRNTGTGAVVWSDTSGFELKNFLPGTASYVDQLEVPTGVVNGTYHLYMYVRDSLGYMANMPLFITGVESGTVYRIRSNVVVSTANGPSVNAGTDQNTSSSLVQLSGSATDPDGTITGYAWSQVSGPSAVNFLTPTAATTYVGNLVSGTYVFRLIATDNSGVTGSDDVSVTVSNNLIAYINWKTPLYVNHEEFVWDGWGPINTPRGGIRVKNSAGYVEWAGVDEAVQTLASGDKLDFVVSVTPVEWGIYLHSTKPANAHTTASYGVELTGAGDMQVREAGAFAGSAWTPVVTDWVRIAYEGSEIKYYSSTDSITWTLRRTATAPASGVYKILYSGNTPNYGPYIIVKRSTTGTSNLSPTVNAGADQTVQLPVSTVNLAATGSDPDGTIISYQWTKITGSGGTITSPATASTSVTGLSAGTYTFRCTVTDNNGGSAFDEIVVTVTTAPVGGGTSSGNWVFTTDPASAVGNVDGNPVTLGVKIRPLSSGFVDSIRFYKASNSAGGTHVAALYDSAGNVLFSGNFTGETASGWQRIYTGGVQLEESKTYTAAVFIPGGVYVKDENYFGAAVVNSLISMPSSASSGGNGVYTYGGTLIRPTLTYLASNYWVDVRFRSSAFAITGPPNQTITLPTSSVTLVGVVVDEDGIFTSTTWQQISGPVAATIVSSTSLTTNVTGLNTAGTYVFRLTVVNNDGASTYRDVTVTVQAQAPVETGNFSFTEIPFTDPEIRQYDRGAEDWNMMEYIVDIPTQGGNTQPKNFYWRYKWHKLESAQGVYNFSEMESHIRQCMDRRQRFSFGIMHLYVGDWESPPQAGGYSMSYPLYLHNLMQAEAANSRDYVSGNWWVPNVNSPNYLTRMDSLHANVYRFLNNNSYQPAWASAPIKYKDIVTYVDMRGHGNWGEWNMVDVHNNYTEYPTGRYPAYTSLRRIIQSHTTYFPDLQLVALIGAFDSEYLGNVWNPPALAGYLADTAQNARGKVGIRRDDWGDPWSWHVAWTYENNRHTVRDTAVGYFIGNMWKYAPIVGEPASDAWYNGGYSFFPGQVDEFHITSFGEGNYYLGNLTGSMADYFREASKKSGYRIVLTGGNVANTLQSGAPFTLTVNWQNKGVAPVYHEWIPYYELRNASNQVVHTWKADWNLRYFQPSTSPVTKSQILTLPAGVPNGTYSIRMVIRDSVGYAEPFILNIQGRGADGSYLLKSGITVNNTGSGNQAPTVSINDVGQTNSITLPTNSFTLSATAVDPDGTIASYAWTKITGPECTISSPTGSSTNITVTGAGTYVFQLVVTDNGGLTAMAQKAVTVYNAPAPPVANAGADSTVQLPKNWVTLVGSGTDTDGTIASYNWSKVSGPAASIVSPTAASTRIDNLVAGTYVFRLTVTDNSGATGTDDVQVIVNQAAANVAPVANAGNDQTIQAPTATTTLTGSAVDADGTVASYLWTKVSGPTGGSLQTPNSVSTLVSALTPGTYVFRLTVTDNVGASAQDEMQVVVLADVSNPVGDDPIANAGTDSVVTQPRNFVTLIGTLDGGAATSYKWEKVSGPRSSRILNPAAPTTQVDLLLAGTYKFRFNAIGASGAIASDEVNVTVLPTAVGGRYYVENVSKRLVGTQLQAIIKYTDGAIQVVTANGNGSPVSSVRQALRTVDGASRLVGLVYFADGTSTVYSFK